ncbi:MAG: hypothetical protein ABGY42_00080, partial [bacterium]
LLFYLNKTNHRPPPAPTTAEHTCTQDRDCTSEEVCCKGKCTAQGNCKADTVPDREPGNPRERAILMAGLGQRLR